MPGGFLEAAAELNRLSDAASELSTSRARTGPLPGFSAAAQIPDVGSDPSSSFLAGPRLAAECQVPSEGQAPGVIRPRFGVLVAMSAATVVPAAVQRRDYSARDYCVLAWEPTEDGHREEGTAGPSLADNAAEDGNDAASGDCNTMPVSGRSTGTPRCSALLQALRKAAVVV